MRTWWFGPDTYPMVPSARHPSRTGAIETRDGSMRGEPTLLLFHLDLLRNADGVFRVGLRHGAVIDSLISQRAHAFAEVENMRGLDLLGSVFRRDPVHDILTGRMVRVFRRR